MFVPAIKMFTAFLKEVSQSDLFDWNLLCADAAWWEWQDIQAAGLTAQLSEKGLLGNNVWEILHNMFFFILQTAWAWMFGIAG